MTASIAKKITVKGLVPDLKDIDRATLKGNKPLVHVYGIARGFTPDSSQYGDYIRFNGDFEGVNLETGEAQRAGSMILPEIAQNLLHGVMNAEGNNAVEFALEIGIKPSKSPVGYDYTVKPLIESVEADPLKALRGASQKALPAPEGTPATDSGKAGKK